MTTIKPGCSKRKPGVLRRMVGPSYQFRVVRHPSEPSSWLATPATGLPGHYRLCEEGYLSSYLGKNLLYMSRAEVASIGL